MKMSRKFIDHLDPLHLINALEGLFWSSGPAYAHYTQSSGQCLLANSTSDEAISAKYQNLWHAVVGLLQTREVVIGTQTRSECMPDRLLFQEEVLLARLMPEMQIFGSISGLPDFWLEHCCLLL